MQQNAEGTTLEERTGTGARSLIARVPKHVHLVGAGGAGMSGTARLLAAHGHQVSATDLAESSFTQELEALGITVRLGASEAEQVPKEAQLVVHSAAIAVEDPQLVQARERGLRVMKYAEALALLCPENRTIAVAGTHGKTTTAWMTYHALQGIHDARLSEKGDAPAPGALIGGTDRWLGVGAIAPDDGGWFSVEACEYDRSFLQLAPRGAIVTNVEEDHLDYYKTFEAIEEAFARFVDRIHPEGLLVVGDNVPDSIVSQSPCEVWRLGREVHVDLMHETYGYFHLRVRGPGWATPTFGLKVPGVFNVANATCAVALSIGLAAREDGVDLERAATRATTALRNFVGVARRFEPWGLHGGVELVHDYAHHPTEMSALVQAARRAMPGKPIHVLFQPHQHSRTARFLDDFVESLRGVESVVVADVYGARVHIDTRFAGSEELAVRLNKAGVKAVFGGTLAESLEAFLSQLHGGSGALIVGAGDIDGIRDDLIRELAVRGRQGS